MKYIVTAIFLLVIVFHSFAQQTQIIEFECLNCEKKTTQFVQRTQLKHDEVEDKLLYEEYGDGIEMPAIQVSREYILWHFRKSEKEWQIKTKNGFQVIFNEKMFSTDVSQPKYFFDSMKFETSLKPLKKYEIAGKVIYKFANAFSTTGCFDNRDGKEFTYFDPELGIVATECEEGIFALKNHPVQKIITTTKK